jgi:hypothetical protein
MLGKPAGTNPDSWQLGYIQDPHPFQRTRPRGLSRVSGDANQKKEAAFFKKGRRAPLAAQKTFAPFEPGSSQRPRPKFIKVFFGGRPTASLPSAF